jgi:hypothetical protein
LAIFVHKLSRNFEYEIGAWFDSYGVLKSGQGAKQILDRLGRSMKHQVLGAE